MEILIVGFQGRKKISGFAAVVVAAAVFVAAAVVAVAAAAAGSFEDWSGKETVDYYFGWILEQKILVGSEPGSAGTVEQSWDF